MYLFAFYDVEEHNPMPKKEDVFSSFDELFTAYSNGSARIFKINMFRPKHVVVDGVKILKSALIYCDDRTKYSEAGFVKTTEGIASSCTWFVPFSRKADSGVYSVNYKKQGFATSYC